MLWVIDSRRLVLFWGYKIAMVGIAMIWESGSRSYHRGVGGGERGAEGGEAKRSERTWAQFLQDDGVVGQSYSVPTICFKIIGWRVPCAPPFIE